MESREIGDLQCYGVAALYERVLSQFAVFVAEA